jgi:hypothetical protein
MRESQRGMITISIWDRFCWKGCEQVLPSFTLVGRSDPSTERTINPSFLGGVGALVFVCVCGADVDVWGWEQFGNIFRDIGV